jgi:hypothetical protein
LISAIVIVANSAFAILRDTVAVDVAFNDPRNAMREDNASVIQAAETGNLHAVSYVVGSNAGNLHTDSVAEE